MRGEDWSPWKTKRGSCEAASGGAKPQAARDHEQLLLTTARPADRISAMRSEKVHFETLRPRGAVGLLMLGLLLLRARVGVSAG